MQIMRVGSRHFIMTNLSQILNCILDSSNQSSSKTERFCDTIAIFFLFCLVLHSKHIIDWFPFMERSAKSICPLCKRFDQCTFVMINMINSSIERHELMINIF